MVAITPHAPHRCRVESSRGLLVWLILDFLVVADHYVDDLVCRLIHTDLAIT